MTSVMNSQMMDSQMMGGVTSRAVPLGRSRLARWSSGAVVGGAVPVAGLLAAGALLLGASSAGAAAPPPLTQTVHQAVASLDHANAARVHITTVVKGQHSSETIDSIDGRGTATATEGGELLHMLYAGHTLYLKANSPVLVSVLGMPANLASRYGGRWLSAPTSIASIAQLAQLFSLDTYAKSLISLSGPLGRGAQTSAGGQPVIAVTGRIPKTKANATSGGGDRATVLVTASSPHRPVSVSFSDPSSGSTTLVFGHWGEKMVVAAPAQSTPLSALSSSTTTTTG